MGKGGFGERGGRGGGRGGFRGGKQVLTHKLLHDRRFTFFFFLNVLIG